MVRLLRPEMAMWLIAVPLVAAAWLLRYRHKRQHRWHPPRPALSRRSTGRQDATVLILGMLTALLLVAAMVRPQLLLERRTPELQRQDLILVLDRSVSMNARDVRPSRLGRALSEIKTFLQDKPDTIDRVGLVGFAATAVPLAYPTRDLDSLFFYMDWARQDPTPLYGTDIGGAVLAALTVARRDTQPGVAPVFVIISDGEDDGEQLERAIATFRRENLRVHAIGIGSSQSVPIPVQVEDREEFLTGDAGEVLTTLFSENTLQILSSSTGGRYFRSSTGGELRSALDSAALAERRQVGWNTTREYRDLYLPLLAAAGLCSVGLMIRL